VAKEVRRNGFKTVGLLCADGSYHGMIDGSQKARDGVTFTLLIENNGRFHVPAQPR